MDKIEKSANELENKTAQEVLEWAIKKYKKISLANSLGAEDIVLVDLIQKINPKIEIFTLDTGRLNEETYEVFERLKEKYPNGNFVVYRPENKKVEELIKNKGAFSFRKSVENRKECCNIRKVEPLKRALNGLNAWITGLRREQSATRADIKKIEFDNVNNLVKVNPLADWSNEDVWDYIKKNKLPYNRLYGQNYTSIGCEPCTRPIKKGEDIRAGRWWWESKEHKECGLHKR